MIRPKEIERIKNYLLPYNNNNNLNIFNLPPIKFFRIGSEEGKKKKKKKKKILSKKKQERKKKEKKDRVIAGN